MFYLMKLRYAIFSNIKVTNIERSAFWGTPGIGEVVEPSKLLYIQLICGHHCLFVCFFTEAMFSFTKKVQPNLYS